MNHQDPKLDAMASRYQEALRPEDIEWLKNRGLRQRTIDKYKLGYCADGRFQHSISIPYLNPYGKGIRAIRYRYLNPITHKYDGAKGVGGHLYNVENTLHNKVWICEGEFDSLILTQEGLPAVAVPGANAFKPAWKYLFTNCDLVSLVFDADDAGDRAAGRLASLLGDVVADLRIVRLPEKKDITDMFGENPELLMELVS